MMKKKLYVSLIISFVGVIIFFSCKKDAACKVCGNNKPPIANAGPDQTIPLAIHTVTLNGSASSDPDNNITTYLWTKISGPSSFGISNSNVIQTQVTNLVEGVYQFELKVTDAGGLFAKDTMQVNVNKAITTTACDNSNRPQVSAQLIPVGTLSQARIGMAVAATGNKILFAGGFNNSSSGPPAPSSRVDIYDISTNTWSTAELGLGRYMIAAVASGNKVFFGGGETGDGTDPVDFVDIYDVSTNTWTTSHLSSSGNSIAAAAIGNKVLFAGGDPGYSQTNGSSRAARVDIYDLTDGTWSTASLSEMKVAGHTAVTVNNKVYVAGGENWEPDPNKSGFSRWYASAKVDIYDNATNTWTTSSMQEGKIDFAGVSVGNKIIWAGGSTGYYPTSTSCFVEIKDVSTGISSIQYLFKPAAWWNDAGQNAVVKDNKIVFYRTEGPDVNKFDIYNLTDNTWSIGVLPLSISEASIISVNNTIYIAGGLVNGVLTNQVWKMEF